MTLGTAAAAVVGGIAYFTAYIISPSAQTASFTNKVFAMTSMAGPLLCASIPLVVLFLLRRKAYDDKELQANEEETIPSPGEALLYAVGQGDAERCAWLCKEAHALSSNQPGNLLELLSYQGQYQENSSMSALHLASASGSLSVLGVLLDVVQCHLQPHLSDILEAKDESGCTPLILAVCGRRIPEALLLIRSGASADAHGPRGRNAFQLACMAGMVEVVTALQAGLPAAHFAGLARVADRAGYQALHLASMAGSLDIVGILLDSGAADVNSTAMDGTTALHGAIRLNRISLVELLLARGAKGIACRFGNTPLHVASLHARAGIVRLIIQNGSSYCTAERDALADKAIADVMVTTAKPTTFSGDQIRSALWAPDNDGLYPLHNIATCLSLLSKSPKDSLGAGLISSSSSGGGGGGSSSSSSSTPAVQRTVRDTLEEALECVRLLLEAGHPIDLEDYGGCNVVYLLCWEATDAQLQAIKLIFGYLEEKHRYREISVLLHAKAESGWTCLHVAHNTPGPSAAATLSYLLSLAAQYSPDLLSMDLTTPRNTSNMMYHLRKGEHNRIPQQKRHALLKGDFTVHGLATYLRDLASDSHNLRPRVVVVCGAGISTNAGIKDFRSSTGLYADRNISKLFSASFIQESPEDFYNLLRKELLPLVHLGIEGLGKGDGNKRNSSLKEMKVRPTASHALLRLFRDLGWLTRVYTQNIDMLEFSAGLDEEDVVECHGSFRRAWCMSCKQRLAAEDIPQFWLTVQHGSVPTCSICGGSLRPDVVMFGEPLPTRFQECMSKDISKCDLLLVMGTSLVVYPVASLPAQVGPLCVRALINKEASGCFQFVPSSSLTTHPYISLGPSQQSETGDDDDMRAHFENETATVESKDPLPGEDGVPLVECSTATVQSGSQGDGARLSSQYRDVFLQGDCDDGARALAAALGCGVEMDRLCQEFAQQ